jgi:hypothetical protein
MCPSHYYIWQVEKKIMKNDTILYQTNCWLAGSQSVSVSPIWGLLNIPAWWSWYRIPSFSFFLSYLGWGSVVLIVGTFESFLYPCMGGSRLSLGWYEASICVVLRIGTKGVGITSGPYQARIIRLVLFQPHINNRWVLAPEGFVLPQVPIVVARIRLVLSQPHIEQRLGPWCPCCYYT